MEELSDLERAIYNDGERLIPGVTHDINEVIRHRGSYMFFSKVIRNDLSIIKAPRPIQIIDLGCGVGHGCYTLSQVRSSHVVGVDHSNEGLQYAGSHYANGNIEYKFADLVAFISTMPEYDYVTSRGVLEHIPNWLRLALSIKWRYRLMFDVPYNEPAGPNPHHVLHNIREDSFSEFPRAEIFFQDLAGIIYDAGHKPPKPNMIICVCSNPDLPKVSERIRFPIKAWQPRVAFNRRFVTKLKDVLHTRYWKNWGLIH